MGYVNKLNSTLYSLDFSKGVLQLHAVMAFMHAIFSFVTGSIKDRIWDSFRTYGWWSISGVHMVNV